MRNSGGESSHGGFPPPESSSAVLNACIGYLNHIAAARNGLIRTGLGACECGFAFGRSQKAWHVKMVAVRENAPEGLCPFAIRKGLMGRDLLELFYQLSESIDLACTTCEKVSSDDIHPMW